mgnify:FL=1
MFFEFGIKDFIDILLVAFVLYYTYKLMKASGSIKYSPEFWFYSDLAGGDTSAGDETVGFYFRHIDECGCNSVDCAFSG